MLIELRCPSCGRAFLPSREDVLGGPGWYRRCPDCRQVFHDPDVPTNAGLRKAIVASLAALLPPSAGTTGQRGRPS